MYETEKKQDLPIPLTPEKCKNAVFIVTGANTGIGLETARNLVRLGSEKVILAVRNLKAGKEALQDVEKTTKTSSIAEVWPLDLVGYASIQAFATRPEKELERLDGVVENACAALDTLSVAEGHETSVTVSVFGTFLLGLLLCPKLKETAKKFETLTHLVVVSSSYGFMYASQIEDLRKNGLRGLDDLSASNMDARHEFKFNYVMQMLIVQSRYGVTKLIQMLVAIQLAELLAVSQTGVVINYVFLVLSRRC